MFCLRCALIRLLTLFAATFPRPGEGFSEIGSVLKASPVGGSWRSRRLSLMRVLPYSSANAFKIRSPVSPLFSGWNWVPYTLPARTAPVTGME